MLGGPTATGKTALAAEAAHALGVDLISADSRQVYRGLDIGTGKDREEYLRRDPPVKTHLLDIVDPEEVFSLFQYQAACYRVLDELSRRPGSTGKAALFVGGSGLYMEAVLRCYRIANVPEDAALRTRLETRDIASLRAELDAEDPDLVSRTDRSSRKRIIRALEIASWSRSRSRPVEYSRLPEKPFKFTVFATALERQVLRDRIDKRLEQRLASGLIEEVEGLVARGLPKERFNLLGMEYREVAGYLRGEKNRETMVDDLRHAIHLLAKRQETWFRGLERRGIPVQWLDPERGPGILIETGRAALAGDTPKDIQTMTEPRTGKPLREVAVAVIENPEGRLLFLLRSKALERSPGLWGFCGGGLEPGETPEQAMEREIREELGPDIRLSKEAQLGPVAGLGQAHLLVHLFKYRHLSGEVILNWEHIRHAWIAEADFRTLDVIAGVDADLNYFALWPDRHMQGRDPGNQKLGNQAATG